MLNFIQKAIFAHCDLMWNLHRTHDVPSAPSQSTLSDFATRISSTTLWAQRGHQLTSETLSDASHVQAACLPSLEIDVASLKPHLRSVRELHCSFIRQMCARHGLDVWCPDLRHGVDAYNLWNTACRIAFYDSFCAVMMSGGWDSLAPNQGYITHTHTIIRMYDHYVHYYQRSRFLAEARKPGSVKEVQLNRTIYARRTRVCCSQYS